MKYKVGDKVRVKENLVVDSRYGNSSFVSQMRKYRGKTMTIDGIKCNNFYVFKEDPDKWFWTDEMLEDVEDITILVKGNKVIAKRGNKVGIAKCSPEDDFDIFVGAKLALERLEEECKPYSWLKKGVVYYFPTPTKSNLFDYYPYADDATDRRYISRGLVFKTKEEAVEAAKKMLAVMKEDGENNDC